MASSIFFTLDTIFSANNIDAFIAFIALFAFDGGHRSSIPDL